MAISSFALFAGFCSNFLILPCFAADSLDAVSRIDSATYQRVVDENLGLRKEQDRLEAETGDLRRKNASLLLDVQDLERKRDQLTAIISQLKTPEETKAEIARLRTEKQVLLREIERLRQALTTANQYSTNNLALPAPATGSDLFRKVEKENADLRQELAKARESTMTVSAGKEALSKNEAALKVEVAQLTGQCKKTAADLEGAKRREVAMRKALEEQARKAFEADKELKLVKSQVAAKVPPQDAPRPRAPAPHQTN